MVLATLSSGAMLAEQFLMSLSSSVAFIIQVSMVLRETSNSVRAATNSSTLSTFSLNCETRLRRSNRTFSSLSTSFFLSSGTVIHMQAKLAFRADSRPSMVSLVCLKIPCLFLRSSLAASSWKRFDLLDFFLGLIILDDNGFGILGIANPGILSLSKQLKSGLGLGFGVIPADFNSLDMAFKELGFVGVLEDDLALLNKILDDASLGLQLNKRFLLPLNQLVPIGIALPVEIDHDLGLHDSGNQLFVLLDQQ